jgi:hypothetical protein
MEKNSSNEKVINNLELEQKQNIEKIKNYLSEKKEKNSLSFIKNVLNNNENDILSDIPNKKIIKVNKDNRSKSKNRIISPKNVNSIIKTNIKIEDIKIEEYENISITQKINNFESRIDNLLNVINDFENKFIKSPETQRIKDQFNIIMNKKIYKNRLPTDPLYKSWIKTECNNNNMFINNDNQSVLKDSFVMDIKNINISINNNRYENNYFITQSNQNKFSHHRPFSKKKNSSKKNKLNGHKKAVDRSFKKYSKEDVKDRLIFEHDKENEGLSIESITSEYDNERLILGKQKIMELVSLPDYEPMKEKELAILMQVGRDDRNLFKKALEELVAECQLERTPRGRFAKSEGFRAETAGCK